MGTTVRQHMGTLRPFLCLQRTAELRGPVSVVLSLSALPAAAQTVMFSMLCFLSMRFMMPAMTLLGPIS